MPICGGTDYRIDSTLIIRFFVVKEILEEGTHSRSRTELPLYFGIERVLLKQVYWPGKTFEYTNKKQKAYLLFFWCRKRVFF